MIGIIDYGAGNLFNVEKAIRKLGFATKIISSPEHFTDVQKLIFPGVGNAGNTMRILRERELDCQIKQSIQSGVPFLGICLGMQLMMQYCHEDDTEGLAIFAGEVFPLQTGVKIPHMGWNEVRQKGGRSIFKGVADRTDFYFVHSFYVQPTDPRNVVGSTFYGVDFCSVIAKDRVVGVQFHPEKSADAGLKVLYNFCTYY